MTIRISLIHWAFLHHVLLESSSEFIITGSGGIADMSGPLKKRCVEARLVHNRNEATAPLVIQPAKPQVNRRWINAKGTQSTTENVAELSYVLGC